MNIAELLEQVGLEPAKKPDQGAKLDAKAPARAAGTAQAAPRPMPTGLGFMLPEPTPPTPKLQRFYQQLASGKVPKVEPRRDRRR